MFFDVPCFVAFVKACRAVGIDCPIVPGIMYVGCLWYHLWTVTPQNTLEKYSQDPGFHSSPDIQDRFFLLGGVIGAS